LLQWGHVFSDVETALFVSGQRARIVLQWGHVFSDVETTPAPQEAERKTKLQWGHVFSDVETPRRRWWCRWWTRFNGATSFQTWRRGVEHAPGVECARELQWGHVFSDVETTVLRTRRWRQEWLQWGHVFSDVETGGAALADAPGERASMGPRLFRRGDE